MASPIGACYIALMTYNAILTIECLVEDFGWDAVMDVLMKVRLAHSGQSFGHGNI